MTWSRYHEHQYIQIRKKAIFAKRSGYVPHATPEHPVPDGPGQKVDRREVEALCGPSSGTSTPAGCHRARYFIYHEDWLLEMVYMEVNRQHQQVNKECGLTIVVYTDDLTFYKEYLQRKTVSPVGKGQEAHRTEGAQVELQLCWDHPRWWSWRRKGSWYPGESE